MTQTKTATPEVYTTQEFEAMPKARQDAIVAEAAKAQTISLLDDEDTQGTDIPEVTGKLSQDGDCLVVRIPLASVTPSALKRTYTAKDGSVKTTKAFKLQAEGLVAGAWVTLGMGGWKSTCAIKAVKV